MRRTKCQSGAEKKKKRKRLEAESRSQKGALDRFVVKRPQINSENQTPVANVDDDHDDAVEIEAHTAEFDESDDANTDDEDNNDNIGAEGNDANTGVEGNEATVCNDNSSSFQHDIFDPRCWDGLDAKTRDILVQKGPKRDLSIEHGRRDKFSRRFSASAYNRVLPNGEKCDKK